MNINTIRGVLNYIEDYLMTDLTEKGDFKLFSEKEIEFTFDFVIDMEEELIKDFLFYLVFVPYNDLKEKIYNRLIEKYPNSGYEVDKAFHYIDSDPIKSLKLCEKIEKKYKGNKDIIKRVFEIKKLLKKEG